MAGNMVAEAARSYIPVMTLDLTDDEARVLAKHLRQAIKDGRCAADAALG